MGLALVLDEQTPVDPDLISILQENVPGFTIEDDWQTEEGHIWECSFSTGAFVISVDSDGTNILATEGRPTTTFQVASSLELSPRFERRL
jgi:predicted nuclease of predicted toxin-antitoxin system